MNLRERADRVFSTYIRHFYADFCGYVSCYTCEVREYWTAMDCGHFISRQHSAVRYHINNCRPQCKNCNQYRGGMVESFEEHLRDDLGDGEVDALIALGRTERQMTDEEYLRIIHGYKLTLEQKGL